MTKENEAERIGAIGNYYGGLYIRKINNKFYWLIEDHDTDFDDLTEYQEIPESLYNELLKFSCRND